MTKAFKIFALFLLCARCLFASSVILEWTDNSNNERAFVVERAVGKGQFEKVAELPANTTTWTDTNLLDSLEHRYRVYSVNEAGQSVPTSTFSAMITNDHANDLVNISSRALSGSADEVSILGFVLNKETFVLLRGVGPSLIAHNVKGAATSVRLNIYKSGTLLKSVTGWLPEDEPLFDLLGAFKLTDGDAATAMLLQPGAYTIHVQSLNGDGIVLAELYKF
jgi:hypothetical protein